ncbi:MAG: VOC family protein [Polyangia bacterium]|jgi:predicted 3-demethylubiquinone-9 3-methyltransferase (glyoxalase superfamily)
MKMNRITPFLWYDDQAEDAARFYCSIFKKSKIHSISPMTVTFELDGQMFYALNGGPHFKFNPAISFFINCKNQKEVDYYWTGCSKAANPASAAGCRTSTACPGRSYPRPWVSASAAKTAKAPSGPCGP